MPATQQPLKDELTMRFTDGDRSGAFDTWRILMTSGEEGHRVLSDVWVEGAIPDDVLLDWSFTLATRFEPGEHHDDIERYHDFVSARLEHDLGYFEAAVQRLSSGNAATNDYLLSLLDGRRGYRELGIRLLRQRHPGLPEFDVDAGEETRANQLAKISEFLDGGR